MRRPAAALRRAPGAPALPSAIGLLVTVAACAADGSADPTDPADVASESPTVPAATPDTPPDTPSDTPASTSSTGPPGTQPGTRPGISTIVTTNADDVSAVRLALQAARDRWRVASVQTYEHQYTVRCDCEPLAATVRVLGGRVLGAVTGRGLELATVAEWFDVLATAIDTADTVEVDFNDDLGHPLHLLIDPDGSSTGDEYGLDTVGFRVVSDPLRRWFTDSWGCGHQFVAATPDQTAALVLRVGSGSGGRVEPVDVGALSVAELRFGADLMSGWCVDVQPPGATAPAVDATRTVTDGTLEDSTSTAARPPVLHGRSWPPRPAAALTSGSARPSCATTRGAARPVDRSAQTRFSGPNPSGSNPPIV